jgi:hypothetical protein
MFSVQRCRSCGARVAAGSRVCQLGVLTLALQQAVECRVGSVGSTAVCYIL